ncbi:MAG: tetratricopeptide repeat protein, partial [Rhodospirillales bacterium]|nr:tetratricopeptide repeat protein [Rhodospirillales bacterium]
RYNPATNRREPWPWTTNEAGESHYYSSKTEAIERVTAQLKRGVGIIDVGCMQVNLYHHPKAFRTLDEAFDPHHNAAYAARFLKNLFSGSGSWSYAVAAYHNVDPVIGGAYRSKVYAAWRGTTGRPVEQTLRDPWDRQPENLSTASRDFAAGRYDKAMQVYLGVLKQNPDHRIALLGKALILDRQGKAAEAVAAYERVLLVDPWNKVALDGLLQLVDRDGDEARMQRLTALRQTAPKLAEVPARLALAYEKRGDLTEASRYMLEAAEKEPQEPRYRLNAALLLDRSGQHGQAARAYEQFLRDYGATRVVLTVPIDHIRRRLSYLKTSGAN